MEKGMKAMLCTSCDGGGIMDWGIHGDLENVVPLEWGDDILALSLTPNP